MKKTLYENEIGLLANKPMKHLPFSMARPSKDKSVPLIKAENLSEEDRDKDYYCPICGEKAHLRINKNKKNCFYSNCHKKGCPIGKRRTETVKSGDVIANIAHLLVDVDKDPKERPKGDDGGPPPDINLDIDEINGRPKERVEKPDSFNTALGIYKLYQQGLGYTITDLGISINDIVLDAEKFAIMTNEGLANRPMLFITERCMPRTSIKSIDDTYTWFRLTSLISGDKEVYIAIKLNNDKINESFKAKVTGNNTKIPRSKKKNIIIFGELKRILGNNQRTCYKIVTNKGSVGFVNYEED